MSVSPRFLLLQVRDLLDPMRSQEVVCFAEAAGCRPDCIQTLDLLSGGLTAEELSQVDVVLVGGSGDYSVVDGGPWLSRALDAMRLLHEQGKPTFASCWGFQALALALGGEVVTDRLRAEVGTYPLQLTRDGRSDPVFGPFSKELQVQLGHQDIVDRLPLGATLLASSCGVINQAFRIEGKPIYATQFHPELTKAQFLQRVKNYPEYIQSVAGVTLSEFADMVEETPDARSLLGRFLTHVLSA
ncbi:MAG: aminotransferase [Planctomycetaceae bacterium]|nr:aminotransferase [Planctomycetaceae bacterium]